MKHWVKQSVAALLTGLMLTTSVPISAFARGEDQQGGVVSQVDFVPSVEYGSTERETATVTYHRDGIAPPAYNVIFLVDVSWQGSGSMEQFKYLVGNEAFESLFENEEEFASTLQIITYQQEVTQNLSGIRTREGLLNALNNINAVEGQGTADATKGLNAAIAEVSKAKSNNNNPTVVFWVLGSYLGSADKSAIESELQKLKNTLNEDGDALITWQYGCDAPNELLAEYATEYTPANANQPVVAAYCETDGALYRQGVADTLEAVLHEHYRDTGFILSLNSNQTVVTEIKGARFESSNHSTEIEFEIAEDGKSVGVKVNKLCQQTDLDLILEVELDCNVHKEQIAVDASELKKLYSGTFDETTSDAPVQIPSVTIDRQLYTITFETGNSGTVDSIQAMGDQIVTMPGSDNLTNIGNSFGGWNVTAGEVNLETHYDSGEVILMPEGNMTLTPAWAHVELELDLGEVYVDEPGTNNMSENAKVGSGKWLNFSGCEIDGQLFDQDNIISVQVIDKNINYAFVNEKTPGAEVEIYDPDIPEVYARHVGATLEDDVIAYLVKNQEDKGKYDLIIAGPGGVKAPQSLYQWLYSASYLKTVDLEALDTSNTVSMQEMFHECKGLEEIKFGENFDTANVTNMSYMFYQCHKLTAIDVAKFNTSKVTTFHRMFSSCPSLTTLNLKSFDTSAATNVSYMFQGASKLIDLDLSGFDTSGVTNMSWMFQECTSLTSIEFGETFDTSQVTTMSFMFHECKSLKSLHLDFDTANVTEMNQMFAWMKSLESITFGDRFKTPKVTNYFAMFIGDEKLTTVDLSGFGSSSYEEGAVNIPMNRMFEQCEALEIVVFGDDFDTQNVVNMQNMFLGCSKLETVDFGKKFNTSRVTDFSSMFSGCQSLTTITPFDQLDTTSATNMGYMFSSCKSLTEIDFGEKVDTSSVTNLKAMFNYCTALQSVKLGEHFDVSNAESIAELFYHCENLETVTGTIKFSTEEPNAATTMADMFNSCYKLKSVPIEPVPRGAKYRFNNLSTMQNMFNSCIALENVDLGNWEVPNLTSTDTMFYNCNQLSKLDLSWSGIQALENGFSITNMFGVATQSVGASVGGATLEIGQAPTENDHFMNAVVSEFLKLKNSEITVAGEAWDPSQTSEEVSENEEGSNTEEEPSTPVTGEEDSAPAEEEPSTPVTGEEDSAPAEEEPSTPVTGEEGSASTEEEPSAPVTGEEGSASTEEEPSAPVTGEEDSVSTEEELSAPVTGEEGSAPTEEESSTPVEEEVPARLIDETENTSAESGIIAAALQNVTQVAGKIKANIITLAAENNTARTLSAPQSFEILGETNDANEENAVINSANETIVVHKDATPAGSVFQYRIHVKYVGDSGARSSRIDVEFPIPNDVRVLTDEELEQLNQQNGTSYTLVNVGSVQYIDGQGTGPMGGRVVTEPYYDTESKTLYASFSDLYAGCEFEVTVWCTNESKAFDKETGYCYWDGIAYGSNNTASAQSNYYRLWDHYKEGEVPDPKEYSLSYQFVGDVPPDAELPASGLYEAGEMISVEQKPVTAYDYYTFTGWTYIDNEGGSQTVAPGEELKMPASNLVLVGTWTLDKDKAPFITVKYQYDGKVPSGAPKIDEVNAAIISPKSVLVGENHIVAQIPENAVKYYIFTGWTPSLSIAGQNIPLTDTDADGVYTNAENNCSISSSGQLLTEQFRDKEEVVVTYTGSWQAFTGTIKFNANGGSGTMKDMENVTVDDTRTLTANTFTAPEDCSFLGWALTPGGNIVKEDQESAAGLITEKNQVVTLYAVWKYTEIPQEGTLTIEKQIAGDSGSGEFNFRITNGAGDVWYMHVAGSGSATLDGTTAYLTLPVGDYTVTELDGLNFNADEANITVDGESKGKGSDIQIWISALNTTDIVFENTVASSNIPNDSSAVINGMQKNDDNQFTLTFEQKKELGQELPQTTTSD
ncbi:BspA family leucine-rich repeat surface protein [Allofournierella massiliensis]|uniref:Surface protein n=2 Tax=Allofournierella massiliensis TaxID=1650663 RepID=A0A4R1QLI3_9FIRM|nr:BspA family leucine-rich repeat surface protein [Fournierella massiliensis]TCL53601.1 surface protein [Fournierella massiliensis]